MEPYVDTLDFGRVPIRKNFTDGVEDAIIDLADNGTNECYASIRHDYDTNQPFAVLLDEDLEEVYKRR